MDHLISWYQQRLHLQNAFFLRIDHNEAMVAIVYKIMQPDGSPLILKICSRPDDYFREVYFLKHFAETLPVPRILQLVEPDDTIHGAILMECIPGIILKTKDFTDELAYEIGIQLARIHLNRAEGYGDLIKPQDLTSDPRLHFTSKFEEGLAECSSHLPKAMLEQCHFYFNTHLNLLDVADGPCMIHRDFRPGNLIVYEGKLKGIIDWSSARASFAQEDFCPMEHGEWASHPSKKSFFAGYASIRPIPDYSLMMPLLRLNKAIATIGFMVKRGTWASSHASLYQYNRQFLETFFQKQRKLKE